MSKDRVCEAPDCGDPAHGGTIYCLPHLIEFHDRQKDQANETYRVFTVFGTFRDPTNGHNAIVVRSDVTHSKSGLTIRHVNGKQMWAAIQRMIKPWFEDKKKRDQYWQVDGEGAPYLDSPRLWDTRVFRRFVWDGTQLIEV